MTPLMYRWQDDVMMPLARNLKRAREQFEPGRVYTLIEHYPRSVASHNHFFAAVADTWGTLHEDLKDEFASPDELRYWALTYTEFRTVREYRARSRAEAMRIAKFLQGGEYCRIEFDNGGKIVRHITPRSQSYPEMNGRDFQRSKNAVFDIFAQKLGVTVEELKENVGRSA